MKRLLIAIILLSSVSSLACENKNRENPSTENYSVETNGILVPMDVVARIREIASEMRTCNDEDPSKHSPLCVLEDALWTPESYRWFENGPRVLIIDQPMPVDPLILGRYKSRTLEVLRLEENGEYVPLHERSISGIRKGFNELIRITGMRQNYFSALGLQNLNEDLEGIFDQDGQRLSNDEIWHSIGSTGIIGEYTPTASFVFAPPALAPASIILESGKFSEHG